MPVTPRYKRVDRSPLSYCMGYLMKNEREKNEQTELLYETDGSVTVFDAKVTGSGNDNGKDYVILDRTCFFPEGGGQQADTGFFTVEGMDKIRVTDVQTVSGQVRHYTESCIREGTEVTGNIDADRRFFCMQIHGAEHIISGLMHQAFGYENVGFHMTQSEAVFDLDGPLTDEQIRDIEERANRIVYGDIPIIISFPEPEEAKKMQYRSKLDIYENVRLVCIEGVDTCACCAPHLRSTGQVGIIRILDHTPHRKGTRITMTAGMSAYKDYAYLDESNRVIMEILSAKRSETADFVRDFSDRYAALKEDNSRLRKKIAGIITADVIGRISKKDPSGCSAELIFVEDLDPMGLRNLVNECTKVYSGTICALTGNDTEGYRYIFAITADNADNAGLQQMTVDFNSKCKGRGGGSPVMTQGTSTALRTDIERYFGK